MEFFYDLTANYNIISVVYRIVLIFRVRLKCTNLSGRVYKWSRISEKDTYSILSPIGALKPIQRSSFN